MPDPASARSWKIMALATAGGGFLLLVIGLAFLLAFDQALVGVILLGVGGVDLLMAAWFARRAGGER